MLNVPSPPTQHTVLYLALVTAVHDVFLVLGSSKRKMRSFVDVR